MPDITHDITLLPWTLRVSPYHHSSYKTESWTLRVSPHPQAEDADTVAEVSAEGEWGGVCACACVGRCVYLYVTVSYSRVHRPIKRCWVPQDEAASANAHIQLNIHQDPDPSTSLHPPAPTMLCWLNHFLFQSTHFYIILGEISQPSAPKPRRLSDHLTTWWRNPDVRIPIRHLYLYADMYV